MNRRSLEHLLQQFVDGRLDDASCEEVVALIKSDPEAMEAYCEYVEVDACLQHLHSGPARMGADQAVLSSQIQKRRMKKAQGIAILSAAAGIVVLAAVLYLVWVREKPPLVTFATSPNTVFDVVHLEELENAPKQGTLAVGSRLMLEEGYVEFTFSSGVRSLIQAPADLTVHAVDEVFLNEGTAWFHVPPKAVGFRVRSPEMEVIDLGTEFGIRSSPDFMDEVHVLTGRVKVRALKHLKQEAVLSKNEARRLDPVGRLKSWTPRPDLFLTSLPGLSAPPDPLLYWSFDSMEEGQVPTSGSLVRKKTIELQRERPEEGPKLVEGRVGQAVAFDDYGDSLLSNWQGISGRKPRTVAFWIKLPAEPADYDSTVLNWGDRLDGRTNSEWIVRVTNYDYHDPAAPRAKLADEARLQLLFGKSWFIGETALTKGEWHHVAICYGGGTDARGWPEVEFYINGRKDPAHFYTTAGTPESPLDTVTDTANARPLTLGRSRMTPTNSSGASFDELYLFDRKLTHDAVRNLANP